MGIVAPAPAIALLAASRPLRSACASRNAEEFGLVVTLELVLIGSQ